MPLFSISPSARHQDEIPVTWDAPNRIPLFASAIITVKEAVGTLHLQVPRGAKAAIHGLALCQPTIINVFDDIYEDYAFTPTPGEYFVELGALAPYSHAFITGEFDLATTRPLFAYYELSVSAPCLELSRRRRTLQCDSWTTQGHPFYSGRATYRIEAECHGENILELPSIGNVATLAIDDNAPVGFAAAPPFRFTIPSLTGHHTFHIQVENTLANVLDAQCPASGLLAPPQVTTTQ